MSRLLQLLTAFTLLAAQPSASETTASDRVALVIGMAEYQSVPALKNTINDAQALSETLTSIGFEVETVLNASRDEVIEKLDSFAFRAETADLALIYFAGHGVSVQGTTYLIPVDAEVLESKDIVTEAVTMETMVAAVDGSRKMSILILDSCRDNPFPDTIDLRDPEVIKGLTTGKGGLAEPSPERGTLVAFAARDGEVAMDGDGANSPFNVALRNNIAVPKLEISLMFRQVRDDVLEMTGNVQEPATYGSLPGEPFYLTGDNSDAETLSVEDLAAEWSHVTSDNRDKYLELAAAGDTRSMKGLAIGLLDSRSPLFDPKEAASLLEQASAAGDPEAMFRLAELYETGLGITPDPAKALEFFQASAALDYPRAVNDVGYFYYFGELGLEKNPDKALEFFRRAADLGHNEAMFNVASFAANDMAPGLGAEDAANYLYLALRGGSELALDGLLENPEKFPAATWKALQVKLAENGFYDGEPDGQFGPGTRRSVRAAYGILDAEN